MGIKKPTKLIIGFVVLFAVNKMFNNLLFGLLF